MPWKERTAMEERREFVEAWMREEESFAELCRSWGISRPTGYKWVGRFKGEGYKGLEERSREPLTNGNAYGEELRGMVLEARGLHPRWGPKKLLPWLQRRHPEVERWPRLSTAGEWLRAAGLSVARGHGSQASPTVGGLTEADCCHRVWCADRKGWFLLGDGRRCDPVTISEGRSRCLLRCQGYHKVKVVAVRRLFRAVFEECGLPEVIRIDNGSPFASGGLGGLTLLSVWWMKLGIVVERIEPGKPYQNGSHERMHRTLKEETQNPPERNLAAQQRRFDEFRKEYNEERPHEALGQRPPMEFYEPSPRLYPSREPRADYPSGMAVRQVKPKGEIRWEGGYVYVSQALAGEPVGLEQEDERYWTLYFGQVPLAILDSVKMTLRSSKSAVWKKYRGRRNREAGCGNDVL